jgi:phosphatidylserine decarboxylase
MPLHLDRFYVFRECIPILGIQIFLGLILFGGGIVLNRPVFYFTAIFTGISFCFTLYFFRNPERDIPKGDGILIAPADGYIVHIGAALSNQLTEKKGKVVSIFLTVWDVHVNRIPLSGTVLWREYHKGRFYPAFCKRASQKNEYNVIALDTSIGRVIIKQIAGLIIRRIICRVHKGDQVKQGDPYGMIIMGSRIELLLPDSVNICVRQGQHVRAGETVIGVHSNDP